MNLEQMLRALGEPMRLRILQLLLERKHCVRSLSRKLEISEPAVSQHLKVMREAGLVYREKFGHHTHYLPDQVALGFLADAFRLAQQQAVHLEQEPSTCHCTYSKEGAT